MGGAASQVCCADVVAPAAPLPASSSGSDGAACVAQLRMTLWIWRSGAPSVCKLEAVDPDCDAYDLAKRWLSEVKEHVPAERITLHLLRCRPGEEPTEQDERDAIPLNPQRTLREAKVKHGDSLLVKLRISTQHAGTCCGCCACACDSAYVHAIRLRCARRLRPLFTRLSPHAAPRRP